MFVWVVCRRSSAIAIVTRGLASVDGLQSDYERADCSGGTVDLWDFFNREQRGCPVVVDASAGTLIAAARALKDPSRGVCGVDAP